MLVKLLKDDIYYVVDDDKVLATLSTNEDANNFMKEFNFIYNNTINK